MYKQSIAVLRLLGQTLLFWGCFPHAWSFLWDARLLPSKSEDQLQDAFACFLLELGRELVSWSSFTWEKSSFTELSKVIRFLQVFSQELLETCRTRTYVLTDKNLRSIIFLTGEGEKIQMKTIASSWLYTYLYIGMAAGNLWCLNSCFSTPVYFGLKCVSLGH